MLCIECTVFQGRRDMVFSELYSAYYNTVAHIISAILDGEHGEKELGRIVCEYAFGESIATILPSLKSGKWQLVRPDMTTVLGHKPTMPLTLLQKRWLKAISLDPRIKLFDAELNGLEDIEPLFTPDDYYIYDKYSDGDPFEDEEYIKRFRFLLSAIRNRTSIKLNMQNKNGKIVYTRCLPVRLEYSEKDDKFRLITSGSRYLQTVNLAKIVYCSPCGSGFAPSEKRMETEYGTVTLRITNERNALERCMLHFAHFEKQAKKLDRMHYQLTLKYDKRDEAELVIRVLSFGPRVEVIEPGSFRTQIKEKLIKQRVFGLK